MISLKEARQVMVDALYEYISLYQQRVQDYPCDRKSDTKELKAAQEVLTAFGKRFELEEIK